VAFECLHGSGFTERIHVNCGGVEHSGRKPFLSEEKNQKTFALDAVPDLSAMARTDLPAPGQSFLVLFFGKELLP
jgi:hypothetical protein